MRLGDLNDRHERVFKMFLPELRCEGPQFRPEIVGRSCERCSVIMELYARGRATSGDTTESGELNGTRYDYSEVGIFTK